MSYYPGQQYHNGAPNYGAPPPQQNYGGPPQAYPAPSYGAP
jgi:hypothetical protein